MSGTISIDEREADRPLEPGPALFVVLSGGSPLAGSSRHALGGIDEIEIGRGEQNKATRRKGALMLEIADPAMSSRHARIGRRESGFVIEDAASKNGTTVYGKRIDTALLSDGATIVLGQTALVFRASCPLDPEGLRDASAADIATPHPLLTTILPPLARSFERLALIARAPVTVVIAGETGTGKELAARATHDLSGRCGRFVGVNCGAIPEPLVESELFGHKRGAFSGAFQDTLGLVRAAEGGTLFLDEIGDLPLASQAALLRALQEREVTPVGSTQPIKVDFRLVSATNADLATLVARGKFRADLFARIGGLAVDMPPLRTRREDLGIIVSTLLLRLTPGRAGDIQFASSGVRALFERPFPGNVRELERALETAIILARGAPITESHLAATSPGEPRANRAPRSDTDDPALREQLVALFREHDGNVSAVARALGKARFQVCS